MPPAIDGFRCEQEIGRGGYGVVYRARQESLGRVVAVKVLPGVDGDPDSFARFLRECQALGAVGNHPNIATVYGCGVTEDGAGYLAMELLTGGSLAARVADRPLPWREAATIGVALAGALETAHRVGVLHRDLKPENVMFDGLGTPKLLDFGIATVPGGYLTGSRAVSLTLVHAAPEVLAGARGTAASDVYSLASTLYAAIRGTPAFVREGEETLLPLLARIAAEPVPDLRPAGVPDELCRVLEQALAKDPAARPLSAEAFGMALAEVLGSDGGPVIGPPVLMALPGERPVLAAPGAGAQTVTVAAPVPAAASHGRRRRAVLAAGVAAAVVGLLAYALTRTPPSTAVAEPPGGTTSQGPTGAHAGVVPPAATRSGAPPASAQQPAAGSRTTTPAADVGLVTPPASHRPTSPAPHVGNQASPSQTPSATPTRTVAPLAPLAPTPGAVSVDAVTGGATPTAVRVSVSWAAASTGGPVSRYQLRRTLMSGRAVAGAPVTRGVAGTAATVLVPRLDAGTQWYRWQVRAVGPGGRSAWVPLPAQLADLTGLRRVVALAQARAVGLPTWARTTPAPARGLRGQVASQSMPPGAYRGGTRLVLTVYGRYRP